MTRKTRKAFKKRTRKTRRVIRSTKNKRIRKTRRVIRSTKNKRTRNIKKIMKGGLNPSTDDWGVWDRAINNGNLELLKTVYPSIINHTNKTRGGNTTFTKVLELLNKNNNNFNIYKDMLLYIASFELSAEDQIIWDVYKKEERFKQPNQEQLSKSPKSFNLVNNSENWLDNVNYHYPGREEWNDGSKNVILFYKDDGLPFGYFWLTNFYMKSFIDDKGVEWKSGEHYFQAQKYIDNDTKYKEVQALDTPDKTLFYANNRRNNPMTYDRLKFWDNLVNGIPGKENIMWCTLWFKFQDPVLRNQLLVTGDAELIENSYQDDYWGICNNKKNPPTLTGQNRLGVLLMKLRKYLQDHN